MPPGTGDVALSLSQTVPAAGAIVVTTPQQVSLADSRRAVRMYQKLNIPTLGLVENMSFYECTNCHHHADIFGHGGGEQMAQQLDIPFLGRLPLYQPIRVGSDRGIPLVIAEPDSAGTRAFMELAEAVMSQLAVSRAQGRRRQQRKDSAHPGQMSDGCDGCTAGATGALRVEDARRRLAGAVSRHDAVVLGHRGRRRS